MKKADMNSTEAKSYRSISNLSVLYKILERLDGKQLVNELFVLHLTDGTVLLSNVSFFTIFAVLYV